MTVRHVTRLLVGASTLMIALAAHPAFAQAADPAKADNAPPQTDAPAPAADDKDDIVVTGTLIRGIAPVGTNVIGLDRQAITATGATSANDILTHIPQVTSAFLNTPTAPDGGLSIIRPNLRDLGASGTNTTLVIIDGHRVVGAGLLQTTPDPDVIPPGVLERVEIVPDGGSSIYGSDAIGGVVNFITRKRFDGFEASGHYGFAADYRTADINLTAGKDWGTGSAYLSYVYAHNDAIFGRDRGFIRQLSPNAGYCAPGTIFANGTSYALPGRTPGTMTQCDVGDNQSFWPSVTRNTLFGSINQEIGKSVTLDIRGFYTRRELTQYSDLAGVQPLDLTVTPANYYFSSIAGETSQVVRTSFAGVIDSRFRNNLTEFNITPSLTARLGGGWELRLLTNYGRSITETRGIVLDQTALALGLASGNPLTALNPYDLGSSNPTALASLERDGFGRAVQELYNARAIAEGPLFRLPGGEARLAAGVEYIRESSAGRNGVAVFGQEDLLPKTGFSRNVKAAFGELVLPVVGADNAMSGIRSLTFSASGRYDDYSDVGGTFNPKLGVTYEPLKGIKIRANWGKSFNAPSVLDRSGVQALAALPINLFVIGQQAPWTVVLAGNNAHNRPQTANTWSLGADIQPSAIPGLTLSATYYNLHVKDLIGIIPLGQITINPATAPFVKDNLHCSDLPASYFSLPTNPAGLPLAVACALAPSFALVDARVQNLGIVHQDGIDFNLTYNHKTGFGSVNASVAGTYTLDRKVAIVPGAPFVDDFSNPGRSRMFLTASAGFQTGGFGASATMNRRSGYDLAFGNQSHIGSFTTVDLFLSYQLPKALLGDASLTLNVTNLFDQDPPFSSTCSTVGLCGFANGMTLGRQVEIGVRKKF